jgi:hypothetical protein
VTWENSWPIFNQGQPLSEHIPGILRDKPAASTFHVSFTSTTLDPSFFYHRTPYKPFHSLAARPGYLRINASPYAPGDRDVPALLLRKQTSYNESIEVQLDDFVAGDRGSNLTEAGLSVFYDDLLHNDIGVAGPDRGSGETRRKIVIRTKVAAQQVGPWALVPANNTVMTVSNREFGHQNKWQGAHYLHRRHTFRSEQTPNPSDLRSSATVLRMRSDTRKEMITSSSQEC